MSDLHADLVECLRALDAAPDGASESQIESFFTLAGNLVMTHRDELLGVVEDAARYREWRRIAVTGCSDQFGDAMIAACEQQSETMVDAAIDAARHGRGE